MEFKHTKIGAQDEALDEAIEEIEDCRYCEDYMDIQADHIAVSVEDKWPYLIDLIGSPFASAEEIVYAMELLNCSFAPLDRHHAALAMKIALLVHLDAFWLHRVDEVIFFLPSIGMHDAFKVKINMLPPAKRFQRIKNIARNYSEYRRTRSRPA